MISARASLPGVEWLEAGWKILRADYWGDRDYLVPTYCKLPASYGDFAVWTRQVLLNLREVDFVGGRWVEGDRFLLHRDAGRLWTEHSERNWLVSMAAALGIHREERQVLGRWAVKESSDEYVRSARRLIAQVQLKVVQGAWEDREWDLRHLGIEEMEEYLVQKLSWTKAQARVAVEKLQIPVLWRPEREAGLGGVREISQGDGIMLLERAEVERNSLPVREVIRQVFVEPGMDLGSEDDVDVQTRFFISVHPRSKHRKLHVWGKCGTKSGENFSAYEAHDSLRGVVYNSLCGHCWKGTRPEQEDTGSSSSSGCSDLD